MAETIADATSLRQLRERIGSGESVAVYRNEAMDSATCGHHIFLLIGPTRTFQEPPKNAPDGAYGAGWKYCFVGFLNLETNQLRSPDGHLRE